MTETTNQIREHSIIDKYFEVHNGQKKTYIKKKKANENERQREDWSACRGSANPRPQIQSYTRAIRSFRFAKLCWVGLDLKTFYKYYMETNERHHNPRPQPTPRKFRGKMLEEINVVWKPANTVNQGHHPTHENSEKKWLEVRFWPF